MAPAASHGSKPFLFDAPVALLDGLKADGIRIVSFANNHVMDQGCLDLPRTATICASTDLLFVGLPAIPPRRPGNR